MTDSYVQLGSSENLSSNSPVRARAKTPWSDSIAESTSTQPSFILRTIAEWKVFQSYKVLGIVTLLLFTMGCTSSADSFKTFRDSNIDDLCKDSKFYSNTNDTEIFGALSVTALILTLIIGLWSFGSYLKIRLRYRANDTNIYSMRNYENERARIESHRRNINMNDMRSDFYLRKVDGVSLSFAYVLLVIAISWGYSVALEIQDLINTCDSDVYGYNEGKGKSIVISFDVLFISFWSVFVLSVGWVFVSQYLLKVSGKKNVWINKFANFCCC